MNINCFIIMRKDGTTHHEGPVKPIMVFTNPVEAMDCMANMGEPLMLRSDWKLVGESFGREDEERYKNDFTHYSTCGRIFEYENTHNGDIREIEYYIEMV